MRGGRTVAREGRGAKLSHVGWADVPITILDMSQFVAIAEQLRAVKAAEEQFIALWALDCLFDETRFIDKLAADLRRMEGDGWSGDGGWSMS